MRALILWDVDHTLVENDGVSKETYAAAYAALAGEPPASPPRTGGRTDRAIMRQMFEDNGLVMPPWSAVDTALQQAGAERADAMRSRGWALPGVHQAISAIAADPRFIQSVLTGNIRENAQMKLSALQLQRELDFTVGAYGSDAEDRAELVAIAQRRASSRYRDAFSQHNTALIGDTPRDVDAGLRGGAVVIAVASGVHDHESLAAAGATTILPNLVDTARLMSELTPLLVPAATQL